MNFRINGNFLTKFLREIGIKDMLKAVDIAMNDVGMTYKEACDLCLGRKKLVSDGDLLILEDDIATDIYGVKLYKEEFDVEKILDKTLDTNPF